MEVTSVRFFKSNLNGTQVGYGSLTLDSEFAVNYSLMNGRSGLFVSFPSRKGRDGKYYDEAFPLSKELRQKITDAVIAASQQAAPAPVQQPAQTAQPQYQAPQTPAQQAPVQSAQPTAQQPTPAAPAQAVQTPQQPAQPQPEAPQGADPAGSWGW